MKRSRLLMITGSLLILLLFVLPLWQIELAAPQYPDPIGMHIWINKITGIHPNDVQNINILNHYVGMKEIPEHMKEFELFPPIVIGMAILGVIFGLIGKHKLYIAWFVIMALLGTAGMYDFYKWEYDYGHNLREDAAIKFVDDNGEPMAYQPPLFGTKLILNFKAMSYPATGAYFLFAGMLLSVAAFAQGKKESENDT